VSRTNHSISGHSPNRLNSCARVRPDVILMQRRPVRSGVQVLKFVTAKKPAFAGVDPYNYYIDRSSGDNVQAVATAAERREG
jgi:hypothetical protein